MSGPANRFRLRCRVCGNSGAFFSAPYEESGRLLRAGRGVRGPLSKRTDAPWCSPSTTRRPPAPAAPREGVRPLKQKGLRAKRIRADSELSLRNAPAPAQGQPSRGGLLTRRPAARKKPVSQPFEAVYESERKRAADPRMARRPRRAQCLSLARGDREHRRRLPTTRRGVDAVGRRAYANFSRNRTSPARRSRTKNSAIALRADRRRSVELSHHADGPIATTRVSQGARPDPRRPFRIENGNAYGPGRRRHEGPVW